MRKIEVGNGIDIIGDIHACYEEFIELIEKLGYKKNKDDLYLHPQGRKILSLGDIMSRGPESLKTMMFFLNHIENGQAYMTDSNHGWKIARWLDGRKVQLKHGDEKVEEEFIKYEIQFGVVKTNELKQKIKELLMKAPSHYILMENGVDTVVCTHAGIKDEYIGKETPKIKNFCRYGDVEGMDETGKPIRKDWFSHHNNKLLIIWGHDPKPEPFVFNNTINIDQGVVFGGKLTAFRYPEREFIFLDATKDYSDKKSNPLNKDN